MTKHEEYMKLALQNARAMRGQTSPNPLVGSVIVNDGAIVGVGAHMKAGEPHAEIHALRMAGEKAQGGTIYVTLEPCSHQGRTGPCAVAIKEAGLKKVVIAMLDPNPLVAGRGVRILEEAGIEVEVGVCEEEARQMNEVFLTYITNQRPFVTLKSAITLDGKIASHSGSSKWITSEEAREDVHMLRHEHSAILVGVGTVLADDPQLTTRLPQGRNPIRIVMDSKLRTPRSARIVMDGEAPTWIFTSSEHDPIRKQELEEAGCKVFVSEQSHSRISPSEVLQKLAQQGVDSVLVEGGGQVNAAFMEAGVIDKVIVYIAPKLIGGKAAPTFLTGEGIALMSEAIQLDRMSVEVIGKDLKITGYPSF